MCDNEIILSAFDSVNAFTFGVPLARVLSAPSSTNFQRSLITFTGYVCRMGSSSDATPKTNSINSSRAINVACRRHFSFAPGANRNVYANYCDNAMRVRASIALAFGAQFIRSIAVKALGFRTCLNISPRHRRYVENGSDKCMFQYDKID